MLLSQFAGGMMLYRTPRRTVIEAMLAVTLCDFALKAGIIPGVIK